MEEYMNTLKENLNYIMGYDELTYKEMAKRCGISERKLQEIIYREKKGINFSTLCKIAKNLNIPISKLIEQKNAYDILIG